MSRAPYHLFVDVVNCGSSTPYAALFATTRARSRASRSTSCDYHYYVAVGRARHSSPPSCPSNTPPRGSVTTAAPAQCRRSLVVHTITPRTNMIVLDTPHNPLRHVFMRVGFEAAAHLADDHDLLVKSDEVVHSLLVPMRRAPPH
ncbi:uncharacterized protein B0H18DRAFT_1034518 [Fomitopsis serialis]|uniref:uncharacterized protein n=1 Tax=Fomitopsis serialis TaxID=139415 RepID=UPI002007B57D|nr:uncharacterized protein B0H18DRAFT_1034518 [Neoantrodia serialis]KAH9917413.1 hypothetical protein B0H18DRAFT_1034518 [Neoantrodia serialis]